MWKPTNKKKNLIHIDVYYRNLRKIEKCTLFVRIEKCVQNSQTNLTSIEIYTKIKVLIVSNIKIPTKK